jgi:hypothetical protein
MTEVFKSVVGYEGLYEVSNFGRVKSLERKVRNSESGFRVVKERILKPRPKENLYFQVMLCKNQSCANKHPHKLVAEAFLKHTKEDGYVVNHKDFNRQNNLLSNLELLLPRDNTDQKHLPSRSIYTGVFPIKDRFRAAIKIQGKTKHIGLFDTELEASGAYEKVKKAILKK